MSSEVEALAEVLVRAAPSSTSAGSSDAAIAGIDVTLNAAGQVLDVVRVTVKFPAGRFDCQWLGTFSQEVINHPVGPEAFTGAKVLVIGGVVIGSIYPRGT